MRDTFIKVPFAEGGDKTPIPNATQPDGSISMQQGWGVDYEKEVGVDPAAKPVNRQTMNQILNLATSLLNRWQTETFPEWIDSAANDGSPFVYPIGAVVRYSADGIAPYLAWVNATADNATSPSVVNGWILLTDVLALAKNPTETERGAPFLASDAEADAGVENTKMMSAVKVLRLIRAAASSATESLRGTLLVGTQAQVEAGALDNVAVTPKKLKDAGLWPIGVGQSWQDMTTQRALGVTYTNTTGRPIEVSVLVDCKTQNSRVRISVDGNPVNLQEVQGSGGGGSSTTKALSVSAIVPNGSTYGVTQTTVTAGGSGTPVLELWMELR